MKEKEIKRFKFNERGGLSYDPNGDMVLYDDVKQYLPK